MPLILSPTASTSPGSTPLRPCPAITLGLFTLLEQGSNTPALYTLVITGALLAVVPLIALFLVIQRFWSLDLLSGAVKS